MSPHTHASHGAYTSIHPDVIIPHPAHFLIHAVHHVVVVVILVVEIQSDRNGVESMMSRLLLLLVLLLVMMLLLVVMLRWLSKSVRMLLMLYVMDVFVVRIEDGGGGVWQHDVHSRWRIWESLLVMLLWWLSLLLLVAMTT
jgi:hypothetical protein